MPMFDYRCRRCGEVFEELVPTRTTPDAEIVCPKCKQQDAERLLSVPMISMGSRDPDCVTSGYCKASSGFS